MGSAAAPTRQHSKSATSHKRTAVFRNYFRLRFDPRQFRRSACFLSRKRAHDHCSRLASRRSVFDRNFLFHPALEFLKIDQENLHSGHF